MTESLPPNDQTRQKNQTQPQPLKMVHYILLLVQKAFFTI